MGGTRATPTLARCYPTSFVQLFGCNHLTLEQSSSMCNKQSSLHRQSSCELELDGQASRGENRWHRGVASGIRGFTGLAEHGRAMGLVEHHGRKGLEDLQEWWLGYGR